MKKSNVIKMILMSFHYKDIEIETHWSGTNDGTTENSLNYEVTAIDPNGDEILINECDFGSTIQEIFYEVTNSNINDHKIKFLDDSIWKELSK